jgi:sulfate/thiosulfate transport system permease protein
VIFPNMLPALLSGIGLAFARALGEYGSLVLFAAGLHTTVASVFIRQQIESNNFAGAASVSVVLLLIALVVIGAINLLQQQTSKHDRE